MKKWLIVGHGNIRHVIGSTNTKKEAVEVCTKLFDKKSDVLYLDILGNEITIEKKGDDQK